ncbi:hypothetical protein, partial [Prosthecobacter sp.]|uniref:hypothetical protein n=1 Tax=Prosthecobacter sp. TaxID=1965333 RepID=UPI003785060D
MHFEIKTLHLSEPFRIAHGTSATRQVLRVSNGELVTEAPFVPYYGEDPAQTLAVLNQAVLPEVLPRTAGLALNLLRHDIIGHQTGRPLKAYAESKLGLPVQHTPPGCRSFSIPENLDVFADKVRD